MQSTQAMRLGTQTYLGTGRLCRFLGSVLLLVAMQAPAQEFGGFYDPYPLRSADTSSPRDTLRSFLTSANDAIRSCHEGTPYEQVRLIGSRTLETLDFSQLANRDLPSTQMKTGNWVSMTFRWRGLAGRPQGGRRLRRLLRRDLGQLRRGRQPRRPRA